ncbi:acyl carrier protein [Streptomyces ochraceiscleroticus]|uniref:Acyl carrier protein n=1 Tax=Streptomyces ochraceiscleroticus TaxID=47761 RepID=A0ABW1MHD6_9ACTN|nr:acyl carrier protein [Streptomyces ochraceiscleroticus]
MPTLAPADIKTRLVTLLSEKFGLPEDEILAGATFDELDIDSLILVELGLLVRKELGIVLAEGDLKSSFRIDDAVAVVAEKGGLA